MLVVVVDKYLCCIEIVAKICFRAANVLISFQFSTLLIRKRAFCACKKGKLKRNKPHTMCGAYLRTLGNALEGGCCYYTLISTSTPQGNSSFIRASTVLDVEL